MAVTMAWAQNGTPQVVGISQLQITGSGIRDFVIINGDGYIRTDFPNHLSKINLTTRQTQWVKNLTSDLGTSTGMVKTPDGNICYSDGANIMKLSTQGDTLWTRNLSIYGSSFSLSQNSQIFLTCYSMSSNLVLLDYSNGNLINYWAILTGGLTSSGNHNAHAGIDSTFYCFDTTPAGSLYNTEVKMSKIKIINNVAETVWCLQVDDLMEANGIVSNNIIYLHARQVNPWVNGLVYKLVDQGTDYQIESIIDVVGPDSVGFAGNMVINNNQLLLPVSIRLGDDPNGEDGYSGAIMSYDSQSNLLWRISQNIMPFCLTQAVATDSNKIYGISCCQQTYGGPRTFWLTELSTTVATDDPVAPIATINLTCYPNPFRGSTSVKFNQIDNSPTTVSIYNTRGQLIRTLVNSQKLSPGEHTVAWDGKTNSGQLTAAGVYFYKMTSGRFSATRKMIMMK